MTNVGSRDNGFLISKSLVIIQIICAVKSDQVTFRVVVKQPAYTLIHIT